ncbi:NAD-dependent succinate-semialdehyde dehydrogenase [Frigidibacter sp. ROC022]|uniref:NAD-dependent succinate-semialdehyde dehydrogenase n=1 Tax=Frigidibacter sp. ROC022 TaxID=2971796 RepID=UPI00215AA7EB|nr:NAD-dependent succinate-semialdehyde dehydrogenase [Frigidibacter sp. ROC022]MCR8723368.1 NAD-dependent succinate-semialdehyde dehydrogenase [Frigidibacter sp. ROC022]
MEFPTEMYIDGALVAGGGRKDVVNPATEELIATVATARLPEAELALQAAKAAFPGWARAPICERQGWMRRLRDEVIAEEELLRSCVHHEMGKPWAQTHEDWDRLVVSLDYYAEEIARVADIGLVDRAGTHSHRLVHEPAGVALAFLAWNFPLLNLAFKIGPAMAAGCPIIIRPSEATPVSAYAVGMLCERIGLPRGVVQILCTDGYDVADALTASTIPAVVTLIGSTKTGQHIMRAGATSIKRYSMELGGNAPVLVFGDADLDLAADVICGVKFSNAGQICVSPNRVFVAESVHATFREKLRSRAQAARVGFDRHQDITTGPLIDGRAWTRIKGLIDSAVAEGATLLAGGGRPPHLNKGHYIAPTVLDGVTETMDVYRQETFGPIVSVIPFADESRLLEMANDCDEGGLTAYLFTRDLSRAEAWAGRLRYGEIQINGVKYDIDLPHGGIGQSGLGHDCSPLALHDYLVVKRITRALDTSRFERLNA